MLVIDYVKLRQSIWRDQAVAGAKSRSGATAIEYAVIVASIAVAIILALNFLGVELSDLFEELAEVFNPEQGDPEPQCEKVGSNCGKKMSK